MSHCHGPSCGGHGHHHRTGSGGGCHQTGGHHHRHHHCGGGGGMGMPMGPMGMMEAAMMTAMATSMMQGKGCPPGGCNCRC